MVRYDIVRRLGSLSSPNSHSAPLSLRFPFPMTAYSHKMFVRGHRHLCEFMERTKQRQPRRQPANKRYAFNVRPLRSPTATSGSFDTFTAMIPSSVDGDKDLPGLSFHQQFSPQGGSFPLDATQASRVYRSFMNLGWEALPKDVTPYDIVEEIIETFGTFGSI